MATAKAVAKLAVRLAAADIAVSDAGANVTMASGAYDRAVEAHADVRAAFDKEVKALFDKERARGRK
jgi:hypothetical protein